MSDKLASTMKACVFRGPERLEVTDLPLPPVGPGDVLMRTGATAICASDVRVFKGEKKSRIDVIQGHETAGTIVQVGEKVESLKVGDRVTVYPVVACGRCHFCTMGRQSRCQSRLTIGYEVDGGLADYVLIPEQVVNMGQVLTLPPGMPFEIAAMTEPFACALNSVETCGIRAGSTVAILGAGPMGIINLMTSKAVGAGRVIVSEPDSWRRRTAGELGADVVIDPQSQDVQAEVLKATGGMGADAVIITVGLPKLIEVSLTLVRKLGFVNIFGGSPPNAEVRLDPNVIHYNEIFLTGTQNASLDQFRRGLELLDSVPNAGRLVTHRFSLADAPQAFGTRLNLEGLKSVVLFG